MSVGKEDLEKLKKDGIKTLLFDWDGCIVRKGQKPHLVVFTSVCKILELCGVDLDYAYKTYTGKLHGIDWYLLMWEGIKDYFEQEEHEQKLTEFRRLVKEVSKEILEKGNFEKIEPLSGAIEFIRNANEVFGPENCVVVTATPTGIANIMLRATELEDCFHPQIFGCEKLMLEDEKTILEKSCPHIWKMAAKEAGSSLSSAMIIEDSMQTLNWASNDSQVPAVISLNQDARKFDPKKPFWCATKTGDWKSLTN